MQEHKKISYLTHRNSVQKTIRMQLNPVGKTMDYFQAKQILENDEKLKENYQKIKEIADRFYRNLNEDVLSKTGLDKLKIMLKFIITVIRMQTEKDLMNVHRN